MNTCPNTGTTHGYRCSCGEFHYAAMQLPLYEECDVCGRLGFGYTTEAKNPPHRACGEALDRWVRSDNSDYLGQLGIAEKGYRHLNPSPAAASAKEAFA